MPWTHQRIGGEAQRRNVVAAAVLVSTVVAITVAATERASGAAEGEATVDIPYGTSFQDVVGILESRQVIVRPRLFGIYARLRSLDRSVKAGVYRLPRRARFGEVYTALSRGHVLTRPVTFPEGLTIRSMAGRIAAAAGSDSASVADTLEGQELHTVWDVPGPGLEGYLFPDTYRFAEGVGLERVVSAMIDRYRHYWTPERRDRLADSGLSEREVVTLASIIQAEATLTSEMRTISSVYHNRLRIGMLLQSDPTVLYALGGHRRRLLHAAIDSVADNPYSTYAHPGLPPGPICAPGADALDAALDPAATDFLYFVAAPDNTHIFTRSLREHNAARQRIRRLSNGG